MTNFDWLIPLSIAAGDDLTGSGGLEQLLDEAVTASQGSLAALARLNRDVRAKDQAREPCDKCGEKKGQASG